MSDWRGYTKKTVGFKKGNKHSPHGKGLFPEAADDSAASAALPTTAALRVSETSASFLRCIRRCVSGHFAAQQAPPVLSFKPYDTHSCNSHTLLQTWVSIYCGVSGSPTHLFFVLQRNEHSWIYPLTATWLSEGQHGVSQLSREKNTNYRRSGNCFSDRHIFID